MNGGPLPSGPQLWTKHIFWEKDWVVIVAILAFHEAKAGNATPQDVEEAKYQAIEACMRYLGKPENAELEFMYAITSFGTKGRAWKYERGMDYLTALFGPESLAKRGDYIELH
ncbi:hypothetical protein AFLA70_341g001231 [Aspergillus flavus AF70]|nr:hypothetical protein AFLA70_341g001231 [Aspergillus flavus AF70]